MAPVLQRACTEVACRFSPFGPKSLQARKHHEHHEGNLEVHVDKKDAREAIEVKAERRQVDAEVAKPLSGEPGAAEGGDEQERKLHASEVGEHARCRDDCTSESAFRPSDMDGI